MQCSIARLQSALAGNLPADEETALHEHLDACDECSTALEGMAGGSAWCREASSLLSEDEFDDSVPTREEWSEIDFTVEHLEPSDEPGVLGRLGGYDVLEIIGHGGMGVVLKAYDRELKRTVAIKVLAPHLARNSLARKRFAREAQAAAAVVHPHVLAIHQVQATGRLPFLVMPLVPGESLAERLAAQGTLELKEILRIGMQAAAGLAAAHEQGLVHRDVKPANILLERGVERAVLTDFGLARAADDVTLTRWGVVAGTPQYMSPEQARGEPLDGRSDLFSLGCALYEVATGVSPFRTDSPLATMRRLVDDSPQPIDAINPELPPWLVAIVHRLLEKDPSRRFQTAAEVSELLEACLAHVQHPAAVPLPAGLTVSLHQPDRASGRFRGPRKLLAGAAVAIPLLLAGVVIVLETNKGTLTIESEADVAVRITEGDEVVERLTVTRGKNDVRIAAGEYKVEIDGKYDSIAINDGNVTIHRGEQEIVKIVQRNAAVAAAPERIEMTVGGIEIVTHSQPIPRVNVKNPDLLQLTALAPNRFRVDAKKPGVTQIELWSDDDKVHTIDVRVLPAKQTANPLSASDGHGHDDGHGHGVGHATSGTTFEDFLAEVEARHGKEYALAERQDWWQQWLPRLLTELQATKDPERQRSIASSAIGIANALEEFNTAAELLQQLVNLSRSEKEAARWQAELDGLHERIAQDQSDKYARSTGYATRAQSNAITAHKVAQRIEGLKNRFPHLDNFFAHQHLQTNNTKNGFAPGTPSNPELYSISYSNGVVATETPPKSGPRRSPDVTYDPQTGIQLNVHFFKGESRGNDLSPSYRIGDLGVHVYVKGPAAEPIRREIDRLLKELGARIGPWAPAVESPAPGPRPTLPPQPSDADRRPGDPSGPSTPTRPDPFPPNAANSSNPLDLDPEQAVHHLVWGETKNGLQAGIAFLGTEDRVYPIGEQVPIAVRLRNVSNQPQTIKYTSARLRFAQPQIERSSGERVQVIMPPRVRYVFPTIETSLKPAQEITFAVVQLQLAAEKPTQVNTPHIVASPGEYRIGYTVPLMGRDRRDWLVTGTLRFEVSDKKADRETSGFSEPRELVLSMNSNQFMLDLDTGEIMDPPATIRPEQAKMDLSTTQVQPYHYPTGLVGHSLEGTEVKPSDWSASIADVSRALAGKLYPLQAMDVGPEKTPTYFFKTRDGAEGILQLLEVTDNPKGIRLRYKTVLADDAKKAKPSSDTTTEKLQTSFALEVRLAYKQPAQGRIEATSPHRGEPIYLAAEPLATSADVVVAETIDDSVGQPAVQITFTDDAATRLGKATDEHRGEPLAILVHGKVVTAPIVEERIGNKAMIHGRFDRVAAKRLADMLAPKARPLSRFEVAQGVERVAFSPDGTLIAIANGNPARILQTDGASRVKDNWKPSVEIRDTQTGDRVASLKLTTVQEEAALADTPRVSHIEATALAFSPNGSLLAVGTSHGQVKLFNTRNGEAHHAFDDREARLADKETPESWKSVPRAIGSVKSLAFSPNGKLLAVCGESFAEFSDVFDGVERLGRATTGPGRLKVWSVDTGMLKHDLAGHSHAFGVAFSADGNTLASVGRWEDKGSGNGVLVWDPHSGAKLRTIQIEANAGTHYVDFSPNQKQIVTGSELYDKENDTSSTSIAVSYPLSGITEWAQIVPGWSKAAFTPDGQGIVVLSGRESIRLLNANTGQLKHELKAADYLPGGHWNDFAIGAEDQTLAVGGVDAIGKGVVEIRQLSTSNSSQR